MTKKVKRKQVQEDSEGFSAGKDKEPDIPLDPGLMSFPHTIGSAVIKPEDMGKTKGKAITAMREQTRRQMIQLYEQMHLLARQAREIRKRIEVSEKIYLARIGFEPVIGEVYYLYQKDEDINILSMVGPGEWGRRLPYQRYITSVKLLADHTWEVMEDHADF